MLNICSDELSGLDLKFNLARCHVICRICSRSKSNCNSLTVDNVELSFVESLIILAQLFVLEGTGVAMSCGNFFRAFIAY